MNTTVASEGLHSKIASYRVIPPHSEHFQAVLVSVCYSGSGVRWQLSKQL